MFLVENPLKYAILRGVRSGSFIALYRSDHAQAARTIMPGGMMSETVIALRSLAPIIYGSTALVVLILVFQSFGIDIVKNMHAFGLKLTYRSKVSRSGA